MRQVIPAEAVEAAARGFFSKWDELPASSKEHFYPEVRAMLEAAAPYIQAQALDAAAVDLDDKRVLSKAFHIFYPEWLRERAAKLRQAK